MRSPRRSWPGPAAPRPARPGRLFQPSRETRPQAQSRDWWGKINLRPAVTVYNSPVLPSEPSSRCPVQPLRAEPSPPTEPAALRQPTPQPFRAGPSDLTIREWGPCGSLVGDLLESFPSLTGFLTGRRGNVSCLATKPQYGTFVHKRTLVLPFMPPRRPLAQVVTGPVTTRVST